MSTKKRGSLNVLRLSTEMLSVIGMKVHHVEWKEEEEIIEICFDHFTEGEDLCEMKWSERVAAAIPHDERMDMEFDMDAKILHKLIRPVRF